MRDGALCNEMSTLQCCATAARVYTLLFTLVQKKTGGSKLSHCMTQHAALPG